VLTSEQARILKLLGHEQAEFRLRMVAVWSNDGIFTPLASLDVDSTGEEEEAETAMTDDEND
jgi:hypothetical protein